jgi:predicted nuclease of predicted toxin-antitoxin system
VKVKLDENLGRSSTEILLAAGHDVATVYDQGLASAPDQRVIEICRAEERVLVTLDLDFANTLRYPPADFSGISVIRIPSPATQRHLREALQTLVTALNSRAIQGKLWIVQPTLIREHQTEVSREGSQLTPDPIQG